VKPAAVLRPPGSPAEDLGPAGGAAGIAEHAAREGVWLAIEPVNRYEDYMTNRLEQAVGLGEEIERQLGLGSCGCALTCST
jgi:sugar phosphate isomerase/epimerase